MRVRACALWGTSRESCFQRRVNHQITCENPLNVSTCDSSRVQRAEPVNPKRMVLQGRGSGRGEAVLGCPQLVNLRAALTAGVRNGERGAREAPVLLISATYSTGGTQGDTQTVNSQLTDREVGFECAKEFQGSSRTGSKHLTFPLLPSHCYQLKTQLPLT